MVSNPIMWFLAFLGTTVGTLLTFILKEQNKKLDTQTAVLREMQQQVTKALIGLGHRFKSLEMALSMEVVTRPNIPAFIREQLEEKLRKRASGDDTRDEDGKIG